LGANLGGLRVRNPSLINPIFRLLVFRVVDFLGRIDGGFEIFEEASSFGALTVERNIIGIIGADYKKVEQDSTNKVGYLQESESKKVGMLVEGRFGGEFEVFLFNVTGLWILVTEDEMHLSKG